MFHVCVRVCTYQCKSKGEHKWEREREREREREKTVLGVLDFVTCGGAWRTSCVNGVV